MVLRKELSREQLYELVWSKPMRDAAADVGISDVGLKKRCRSQDVPVPPRGHWNKVNAGHRMPPRPPLLPQAPPSPVSPSHGQEQELKSTRIHAPATRASFRDNRAERKGKVQPRSNASPSPKKNVRRKRRRQTAPRHAFEHYSLSIERWEWDYSFGINEWKKHFSGAYIDHRTLTIFGMLLRPASVAGMQAKVMFYPADMADRGQRLSDSPSDIGGMWKVRGEQAYEAYLFFPNDVLPSLLPMLIAEKLRFVTLDGMVLLRGRTDIRHFRFDATTYWADGMAV